MVKVQSRRSFLSSAAITAATAAVSPVAERLRAQSGAVNASTPEAFHVFTAEKLQKVKAEVRATSGNNNLLTGTSIPMTIAVTTEEKKAAKEFEFHEGRDHIFQILDGTTVYELGGTPQNARNIRPGEWLAATSQGSSTVTLHKGDMLVVPRGTPHKRITETSVTFILISDTATGKI